MTARSAGSDVIDDGIRFGASYLDVSPAAAIPEPSAALLGALGVLGLLHRRK